MLKAFGGGEMISEVSFEKTTYNTLPFKYEAGTPNIGGNIVMFVPLGFFLRALFPKCRRFLNCMGTVAVIMTTVELCQLFTLRGFCEIDDLMLNLMGAAIGWCLASPQNNATFPIK